MIYVLCLNPAIDCYEKYDNIYLKNSNRTKKQKFSIGGKGINVALMLNNIGVKSKLITVLGGFTGKYIYNELIKKKIDVWPIFTSSNTRINFKITANEETAFDIIPRKNKYITKKIKDYLRQVLREEDILIVSGSGNDYKEIICDVNCKLILDVSGKYLKELVKYKPYLVKPNLEELTEYYSEDYLEAINKLLNDGANMVLATMGEFGSILQGDNVRIKEKAYGNNLLTTVGCGDTYLATFIGYLTLGYKLEEAFKFGAIASALRGEKNEFPTKNDIENFR